MCMCACVSSELGSERARRTEKVLAMDFTRLSGETKNTHEGKIDVFLSLSLSLSFCCL